jgi:PAS domain S-box-containing protein
LNKVKTMNLELQHPLEDYLITCKLTDNVHTFLLSHSWLKSGTDFFIEFVEFIQHMLDIDYLQIDRFNNVNFMTQSLLVYTKMGKQENKISNIKNTPAEMALKQDFWCIPEKVREFYPLDKTLEQIEAESCAGVALRSSDGLLTGIMTIVNRKPIANAVLIERVLKLLALKASTELEYQQFLKSETNYNALFQENHSAINESNTEQEECVAGSTSEFKRLNEELIKELNLRQEKEKELIKATEFYRTIIDYNHDWETWLGPQGKFLYSSPSCLRITGYSVSEFTEEPTLFYKIAHPDDREKVKKHFNDTIEGYCNNDSLDFRIITRQGEVKWIAHSCQSLLNDKGKWCGQRGSNSDITSRKNLESYLVDSQNKLRALTQHMNIITERERTSISREIHDELGHMLTALKYDINNLFDNSELTVDIVKTELPVMCGMVESLIDSIRKIATELRPGNLEHLGLIPSMEWKIDNFRMLTKIKCHLEKSNSLDIIFDENETITIYRIFQEILTNIARHAEAKRVDIKVSYQLNEFMMTVTDDGAGFHVAEKIQGNSLGLLGMQERALAINGEIQFESIPGKGTTIKFLLHK